MPIICKLNTIFYRKQSLKRKYQQIKR